MLAPLSWLRELVAIEADVEEIVAALNQLGLEVEGVEQPGKEIDGVVVAKVLDVVKHPNADKLTLVDIDRGGQQTRVVCGATNVVAGMVVPYAPAGATLPGGFTLERRTIRGEVSDGMLCSAKELGLGEDHAGILGLDPGARLGDDVRAVLGLDDVIFDISLTPNRPDAMCIVGVARELAAYFRQPLTVPEPVVAPDASFQAGITVRIDAPDRCPRYLGWGAQVAVGPSPAWMQQRLIKAGMRPISNVVDVTNYVLLERNQPLHAFDLARLPGRGILVRLASEGERITTLDGVERELSTEDLLICDAESSPQAIAGIMGGRQSEIDESTTEILLEAAYFERMGIARTSKRLRLRSESSARFERGIDPDAVATNAARAMELLVEVAGAVPAGDRIDEHPQPTERPRITLRTSKVNRLLGTSLSDREVLDALRPLEIAVEGSGDAITAVPPSFRPDLEREVDLVEEVARRVGFASIGRSVPKPPHQIGGLTREQRERRLVADALVGAGCSEAVTLPLISAQELGDGGAPVERVVRAANPLRAEDAVLRTRILPGLLRAVASNQARGLDDVALFEVGRVFLAAGDGPLPAQPVHAAAIRSGQVLRAPVESDRPVDAFDAADLLRTVVDALELADVRFISADRAGFELGRAAIVVIDGEELGAVGEIAASTCQAFGISGPAAGFELELERVLAARRRDRMFVAPAPYPPATIDLAFVVAEDVAAADVAATLRERVGSVLEDVYCFDEFRGEAVGPGRRSIALRLRFRAPDRTLDDRAVGALRRTAITAAESAHGAALRE